ncbi:MAG: sialidase family protein [Spirochaetota bacterium]
MNKSKAAALLRVLMGIGLVALATACGLPALDFPAGDGAKGSLNLTIAMGPAARTIAPASADFPTVASYRVLLSRTGYSTMAQSFAASPCAVTGLEAGDWTVTVQGLSSAGVAVASGTTTATIAATGTNSASVTLAYLLAAAGKPGSASITFEFPHSVGIDSVSASLDGTPLTLAIASKDATTDTVLYSAGALELGNPRLVITLKKASKALIYWTERLLVYQGLATTKTLTLAATDFASAPSTPVNFKAVASSTKVTLTWDNVSVAESYTLTKNDGSGAVTLASGTGLAAGTLTYSDTSVTKSASYTYTLSAVNGFGASTAATATATIPTGYSVTYDANGGTGSVPVDSTAYTSGQDFTALGNVGTTALSNGKLEFAGWTSTVGTTTISFDAGDTDRMTGDRTLKAVWSIPSWLDVKIASQPSGGLYRMVAFSSRGNIYLSSDSGATWSMKGSLGTVEASIGSTYLATRLASSPDCQYLVAAYVTGNVYHNYLNVYRSADYGATWAELAYFKGKYLRFTGSGLAVSADGTRILLSTANDSDGSSALLVSWDGGTTFGAFKTSVASSSNTKGIGEFGITADGTQGYGRTDNGVSNYKITIGTSTVTFGNPFVLSSTTTYYANAWALADDGSTAFASSGNAGWRVSTSNGSIDTDNVGTDSVNFGYYKIASIAMSNTGNVLYEAHQIYNGAAAGKIRVSRNGGTTWSSLTDGLLNWDKISCSSGGSAILAARHVDASPNSSPPVTASSGLYFCADATGSTPTFTQVF